MRKLICMLLVFIGIVYTDFCFGQYPPIGILPMEYNPSFAGSVGNARLISDLAFNIDTRSNISRSNLFGLSLSYDKYFPGIRSGIGLVAKNTYSDIGGFGKYVGSSLEFIAAPKISMKGKYTLSPSVSLAYGTSFLEYENTWRKSEGQFSSKFGLLFNAPHYYVGYAALISYGNSELITALQAGYTFQKNTDSKFSFTPQLVLPILFGSTIGTIWPSYNLGFRFDRLLLAANSQFAYYYPTGLQIGWQSKGWRILFSNEFSDGYQASFTLRYIFNSNKKSMHILDNIY